MTRNFSCSFDNSSISSSQVLSWLLFTFLLVPSIPLPHSRIVLTISFRFSWSFVHSFSSIFSNSFCSCSEYSSLPLLFAIYQINKGIKLDFVLFIEVKSFYSHFGDQKTMIITHFGASTGPSFLQNRLLYCSVDYIVNLVENFDFLCFFVCIYGITYTFPSSDMSSWMFNRAAINYSDEIYFNKMVWFFK